MYVLSAFCFHQVGEFYGHANLSHVDGNGDVYIQFRVYSFEYFESVQESILPADFERAKIEGPYEMDYETIYLALYDALYYRCKVLKINGDKVGYIVFCKKEIYKI